MRNPDAFPAWLPVFYEDNEATCVCDAPGATEGSSGNRYRFTQAPVGILSALLSSSEQPSASAAKSQGRAESHVHGQRHRQERAGESLSFDWNFNDGKSRTTTSGKVSHTFTGKGSFALILDVSGYLEAASRGS